MNVRVKQHRLEGFEITWDFVRNDLAFYDIRLTEISTQITFSFKLLESKSPRLKQHLSYLFTGLKKGYEYSVVIRPTDLKGQVGEYSEPLIVKVAEQLKPLLIQNPPKQIRAGEGKNITIKCVVEALPEPSFQWFKDSVELSNSDDVIINGGELKLQNLTRDHSNGNYKCKASNKLGMVYSEEGKLVVECKHYIR